jgi:hypothetical protein
MGNNTKQMITIGEALVISVVTIFGYVIVKAFIKTYIQK